MDTTLTIALIAISYFVALAIVMRFFAFLRTCDSEMRLMIKGGKEGSRFRVISHKKKRKARTPRFATA